MPVPVARLQVAAGTLLLWALSCPLTMPALSDDVPLHEGWLLQSSEKVGEGGARISTTAFKPEGWYATSVPTTVLAALVDNKVYPDPYFGMNLASLPGASYSTRAGMSYPEHNFSNVPMPLDSPFRSSWWFRKDFHLSDQSRGRKVWLHFDGINFRANVWLNGRAIATSKETAGAWRFFEFDVTDAVLGGRGLMGLNPNGCPFPARSETVPSAILILRTRPTGNSAIMRSPAESTARPAAAKIVASFERVHILP